MPIQFQQGITFGDRQGILTVVQNAFQNTPEIAAIMQAPYVSPTEEFWVWNDWHTSTERRRHLTCKVFEDNNGCWIMKIYHVFADGSYTYEGRESPSTLAQRNEKYVATRWDGSW